MFRMLLVGAVALVTVFLTSRVDAACGDDTLPVIDVVGNALGFRYSNGTFVARQFRGVTGTGAEYACVQGWGMFDGTTAVTPYMVGMQSWTIGIVRVPLNEDCWLGINGVKPQYAGQNYQSAIVEYVQTLNDNGFYVILDLHWSAPGGTLATGQNPMPDLDHSPDFWASVGTTFGSNGCVILDLFNEPYPDN